MTFAYEKVHPEHGPFCWNFFGMYDYKKYKNKLTTSTGEWNTVVVCPHCHQPLSPYGGCQNCNEIWLRIMRQELMEKKDERS